MNNILMISHQKKNQKGVTFLEVLIAMVILVTGILGAVAMQATAKQSSFDAMQRSLASSLAQDIISRIRANDATNLALYVSNPSDNYGEVLDTEPDEAFRCNLPMVMCTPQELATHDRYEWELALLGGDVIRLNGDRNGGLINGRGCVFQTGNALTVVVSWNGRNEIRDSNKSEACGTASLQRRQVVVEAFII